MHDRHAAKRLLAIHDRLSEQRLLATTECRVGK